MIRSLTKLASVTKKLDGIRFVSTSTALYGKRNFRKFHFPNKRGSGDDLEWLKTHPEEFDHQGMRLYGYWEDGKFVKVPEMIPDIVVPNLEGFELKPYISYKAPAVVQEPFTPEHLFHSVYTRKIQQDLKGNLLEEDGTPKEPSPAEKMTSEEAMTNALKTGSDLFG